MGGVARGEGGDSKSRPVWVIFGGLCFGGDAAGEGRRSVEGAGEVACGLISLFVWEVL